MKIFYNGINLKNCNNLAGSRQLPNDDNGMWYDRLTGGKIHAVAIGFGRISIILMLFVGFSGCLLDYTLKDAEGTDETDEKTEIERSIDTETAICPHECISKRLCTNDFGGTVDVTLTCVGKKGVCCVTPSGTDLDTETAAATDADTNTNTDPYSDVDTYADSDVDTDTDSDVDTDADSDVDTDPDTGTEENTTAVCEGGVEYNGVCYYMGENGQNCFTVCDHYGRTASDHTISVIGSGGGSEGAEHCNTVGRSLINAGLVPFTDNSVKGGIAYAGVGCSWYDPNGEFWFIFDPPTTLGASMNHWRVCACGVKP